MTILLILLALLAGLYAFLDLALFIGLFRIRKNARFELPADQPNLAILVCARNEEANLRACLNSLVNQNYRGSLSIWVANDRSTDATAAILAEYQSKYPQLVHSLFISEVPQGLSPKKYAIGKLVEQVQAEILLFTDADCVVPTTWASTMMSSFTPSIEFVSGYSYFPASGKYFGPLNGIQALDFLSHRTIDCAGIGLGAPITACGQNLAYRRSTFLELEGFRGVAHVTSGDDDLFMHKLAAKRPDAISYCTGFGSFVASKGASTWRQAWEQRKRWASKTTHYTPQTVALLGSVFLFYVLILIGLAVGFLVWGLQGNHGILQIFALAWAWKSFWDGLVMIKGMSLFRARHLGLWFLPTALLHIPVIVGAVIAGLRGKFTWKG